MDKYIKVQDLIDRIYPVDPDNDGSDGCTVVYQNLTLSSPEIEAIVEEMQAADVAPVVHAKDISPCEKGKWFCCSNCGFGFDDYYSHDERMMRNNELNYCPNCGAKMDR